MDILYYSNYCKHSQKILNFFVKNNLTDKANFICIDKRKQDPNTGQIYVVLENGQQILLPPNVHSVPSLLLVKQNYNVILGDNIIAKYQPAVEDKQNIATQGYGEPMGVSLASVVTGSVVSEQYTSYNATPQELSTKGLGGSRQLFNYAKANEDPPAIATPPDTYRPDKIAQNVTVDSLQQIRNDDIPKTAGLPSFMPPATQSI
jgi:hypothetical protein